MGLSIDNKDKHLLKISKENIDLKQENKFLKEKIQTKQYLIDDQNNNNTVLK